MLTYVVVSLISKAVYTNIYGKELTFAHGAIIFVLSIFIYAFIALLVARIFSGKDDIDKRLPPVSKYDNMSHVPKARKKN